MVLFLISVRTVFIFSHYMKKSFYFALALAAVFAIGQNQAKAQSLKDILGGVASTVTDLVSGDTEVTASSLAGTWTYSGSAVSFDSENLLAKAGGSAAATEVESKIDDAFTRLGIKSGSTSYTFSEDGTYTQKLAGKSISGTYTIDGSTVTMKTAIGLSFKAEAKVSGSTLKLLFSGDKLFSLLKSTAGSLSKVSSNSTLSTITSLADSYDGMSVGFELKK